MGIAAPLHLYTQTVVFMTLTDAIHVEVASPPPFLFTPDACSVLVIEWTQSYFWCIAVTPYHSAEELRLLTFSCFGTFLPNHVNTVGAFSQLAIWFGAFSCHSSLDLSWYGTFWC